MPIGFIGVFVGDARLQMSLDEEYSSAIDAPSYRLGVWSRLAVSLGRSQRLEGKYDPARLAGMGLEIVQRPTGGLTILHHPGTVTLHLYIPEGHPLHHSSVVEAGVRVASWVAAALRILGYRVEYYSDPPARERLVPRETEICMAYTGAADIYYKGRKVAAGALRRTPRSTLYQGYIVLGNAWHDYWARVDGYPSVDELEAVFGGLDSSINLGELAWALAETRHNLE